jgi:hypothetical protein
MSRDGLSCHNSLRPALEMLETRWVPASVGTANQNFIDQVYRDVLHRAPDPGADGWVASLDNGTSREDIVESILDSDEGLRNQVNDLYIRFLDRPADPAGLDGWAQFLRDGNSNVELAARLMASEEYYQTQGGGTDFVFLSAVYEDVLCRPISAEEFEDRGDDFGDGYNDRIDIVESIFDSDEGEDVRDVLSVRSFLRMDVPPDVANDLADGDDDDWVFAQSLLSSDEYFDRAQTLTTADFATIPSCDDLSAQPIGVVLV